MTEIQDAMLHNQYLKAIAMMPFNRIPEYSMANNPRKKQQIPLLRQSIFSKIKGQGCAHRVNGPQVFIKPLNLILGSTDGFVIIPVFEKSLTSTPHNKEVG